MEIDKPPSGPGSLGWARPITGQSLVVIAASAGGLHALMSVLSSLPADFPAAIMVVQHRGAQYPDLLPTLLGGCTSLKVRHAQDGDQLEPGTVYICPPGVHMTTEPCVRLVEGPRLNFVRPSADLLFRSVACAYGDRAIGVVLSGNGSDGAAGCLAIAEAGGTVLAQDPAGSAYPRMPAAAIKLGGVNLVLPLEEIGGVLHRLVDAEAPVGGEVGGLSAGSTKAAPAPPTTVLLADDHRIILDGLRALLESERDIQVVAEAEDGRTAVRLAGELLPDVVVMDISMPDLNGIDATWRIKAKSPRTGVVGLSARSDAKAAARILEAGAASYLCKNAAFSELAVAIRAAAAR